MATIEELQAQLAALTARVDAITAPPETYYTSQYQGETIDKLLYKIDTIRGDKIPVSSSDPTLVSNALSKKIEFDTGECADLSLFLTANKFIAIGVNTKNTPEYIDFGAAANLGPSNGAFAQIVYSRSGNIYIRGYAAWAAESNRWTPWKKVTLEQIP